MIYLLGGPPRCGKTIVARRLAGLMGCPWVQTDYLEAAFAAYFPPGEYAPRRLDPGPGVPREGWNDDVYARFSAAEIVAAYRALAERTWSGVRAVIEYALFDEEDLILEGFHLDPSSVGQFLAGADPATVARVRPLFLIREDFDSILAGLMRGGHKNDWVLTGTQQPATFERIARMIAAYSAAIRSEAAKADFPVCPMDGDFDRQITHALEILGA